MKDQRKPPWLKIRLSQLRDTSKVKSILNVTSLHTVCEEARCPNLGECFSNGTATILILGKICTRDCGFCAVEGGIPASLDESEPERVAEAISRMHLGYVVITSVTRDDLTDGGASVFAKTIRAVRTRDPKIKIEVLIPDFKGDEASLVTVLKESPDVLNHNVETVPQLYPQVRPQADYGRSLELLRRVKEYNPRMKTKSGFMLGLGETREEVLDLLRDLKRAGCDFLTIGQYLQPRSDRLSVVEYVLPEIFEEYTNIGEKMGFKSVSSGPFVRSSFHASEMFEVSPS
jgi:lipoic acid synthetase